MRRGRKDSAGGSLFTVPAAGRTVVRGRPEAGVRVSERILGEIGGGRAQAQGEMTSSGLHFKQLFLALVWRMDWKEPGGNLGDQVGGC